MSIKVEYINKIIKKVHQIESITDNDKVIHINCSSNQLTSLPNNMNFPNLQTFYCYYTQLTSLPNNMNFPNLQTFNCSSNQLTSLPSNMNFPNLQTFSCSSNQLTSLPLYIMNFRLTYISYNNNPLNLPIQITRFINRLQNHSHNNLNVYNDSQNIHNTSIQLSIKESIERLSTRQDFDKFNEEDLINHIMNDNILICKEQLIEYIKQYRVKTRVYIFGLRHSLAESVVRKFSLYKWDHEIISDSYKKEFPNLIVRFYYPNE